MHFLNPENRIYYVDMQKSIDAHGQAQAKTSRLLAEAAQKDYYAEALAKEVAALEGLDESRIIVRQETVWVGKEQSDGTYKIQTSAAAGSAQKPSSVPVNLTEEERKLLAYDTVKKEVVPVLSEKLGLAQDYGAVIARHFGFDFSRTTDLYIKYFKSTTLGGDVPKQSASDSSESNNTNQTRIAPRPPVVITTVT